jgi:hypothetical protein
MSLVMRPTYFASLGLLIGCVESAPESTSASLVLEPANVSVTVIDGKPIAQPFKATLIDDDGAHDVTAQTTFVLADTAFGEWSKSTLEVSGEALGPTEVVAAHGTLEARTGLTVYVRNSRNATARRDITTLFERATLDSACEPAISYPADNVVVPQNLGQLGVQWSDSRDDLFEVSFATTYVETRIYTGLVTGAAAWTQVAGADFEQLAAQHEPIAVRVSGIAESAPDVRCASVKQHVYATDQPLAGNLYTSSDEGIYRVDAAHPFVAPEQLFSAAMWNAMFAPIVGGTPTSCFGCSLSRDGSKLAVASPTNGAIYDFTDKQLNDSGSSGWSFASFNLNGSKLITSTEGNLRVMADDGTLLNTLESKAGFLALDPQVSPDGRSLANVTAQVGSMYTGATIETRAFFDGSNQMGTSTEVVPFVPGTSNYYPAWSPDGRWLVFTRATDLTASIWIVRADGSQAPIQLTAPALGVDVRARFVPQMMSVDGEPMYYITFESRAAYGEQLAAGRMQLWAMPFYPGRPAENVTPCTETVTACAPTLRAVAPAIRLPMQSLTSDNRMLEWIR